MDLPPSQIVPSLADKEVYIASESSFYKVLNQHKLLHHRRKSSPRRHHRPAPLIVTAPNQVWTWDITYLKSDIKGQFYYLYMFLDIYSRKIVGARVYEGESMEYSSKLVKETCFKEGILKDQLILQSDNGGAMLASLQKLGVVPSFSRSKVSDDNPYSDSLCRVI